MHTVLNWTINRDIEVFSKKMVFVPTHKNQHWSLTVIINADLVDHFDEVNETSEIPCILHLDGLSLHNRKEIATNLRIWLNAE